MTRKNSDWLYDGPVKAKCTLALAHGAGVPMDAPFMEMFAKGLGKLGVRVVRFEFPYMHERRMTGQQRPPDRAPILREGWQKVINALGTDHLIIGGKSLGGRIASMLADEQKVAGLVCLGYPFHPPGKPENLRIEHLRTIQTPTLIVQGTRDPFGTKDEVAKYPLAKTVSVHWLEDGEHSFTPRKSTGRTVAQNWAEGIEAVAEFVKGLARTNG